MDFFQYRYSLPPQVCPPPMRNVQLFPPFKRLSFQVIGKIPITPFGDGSELSVFYSTHNFQCNWGLETPQNREKRKERLDFFFQNVRKTQKKCWPGYQFLDWEKYTNNPSLATSPYLSVFYRKLEKGTPPKNAWRPCALVCVRANLCFTLTGPKKN